MTEPKEAASQTSIVIYVRRKPGRPKKYETEDERRLATKRKNESLLRKELAEEINTTTSIQRPKCRKNQNTSKGEIS